MSTNELFSNPNYRFIKVRPKDKIPSELSWQKFANYKRDDVLLNKWVEDGGNIGVATGFGKLLVVDFDDKDFQDKFVPLLPKTLTQRSGSGGLHLFYTTDDATSTKILSEDKRTLADIQGDGKQIIVSPSIHPNGKQYEFINNEPIAFLPIAQLKALFSEYIKDVPTGTVYSTDIKKPSLVSTLSHYGVDTSKNPTACPWHSSKGGKCFSFDESKGVFNCFHCGEAGDVIKFVELECDTNFKGACQELDIELVKPVPVEKVGKPRINMTPELRANPIMLGKIIGDELAKKSNLFYRPYFDQLVEITIVRSKEELEQNRSRIRTTIVDADRLVNLIQERFDFYTVKITAKGGPEEHAVSISKQQAALLIKNDSLLDKIKILEKVMTRPYMYLNKTGLHVEHKGYSEKTNNFYTPETPIIQDISPADAINEMNKILTGFCFEDESDKSIALAYLLTPALRGLYADKRERTPCFALIANRERAGKDYLAGIRGLLYSGAQIDHPPIADGERANVDEWRKKFTSMLMNGETIFHSANNVGYLNNPVFEALITSKVLQDRLLGSNNQKSFDNWLDISFSANLGLRWRGDMSGRLRKINLFYAEEDPNSRTFPIPDLHGYVQENRGYVLSCIYSLIKEWYKNGMQKMDGKTFSSFPVWAKYCGAIMDYHNLGDPLVYQEDDEIGGNDEERIMSAIYELMFQWQCNNDKDRIKSADIITAIREFQEMEPNARGFNGYSDVDEETIMNLSVDNQSGKIKIGVMVSKFKGRILKGVQFKIKQQHKEAKRRKYSFEQVEI